MQETHRPRRPPRQVLRLVLGALLGVVAGVGLYTFRYAEGLSYLSADPQACVNCHIMQPQYDGWLKASHHAVAVCVDCHLPSSFVAKYVAKAESGIRHSKAFTAGSFGEPIRIHRPGQAVLQANCVRCHESLVGELVSAEGERASAVECVHCHAVVGHGDRVGLGGPYRASEIRRGR